MVNCNKNMCWKVELNETNDINKFKITMIFNGLNFFFSITREEIESLVSTGYFIFRNVDQNMHLDIAPDRIRYITTNNKRYLLKKDIDFSFIFDQKGDEAIQFHEKIKNLYEIKNKEFANVHANSNFISIEQTLDILDIVLDFCTSPDTCDEAHDVYQEIYPIFEERDDESDVKLPDKFKQPVLEVLVNFCGELGSNSKFYSKTKNLINKLSRMLRFK